jgi:protein TonB
VKQLNPSIFGGILHRRSEWKVLGRSTAGVLSVYALMLSALSLVQRPGSVAKQPPRQLAVELFDAPVSDIERSDGLAGDSLALGTAAEGHLPALSNIATSVLPKAKAERAHGRKPKNTPSSAAGNQGDAESPRISSAEGVPTAAAPAEIPTNARGNATSVATSSSGGGGVAAGTAQSASGAGIGTKGSAGQMGGGSGARSSQLAGDTQVLPFMDGMSRPTLLSKADIDYTREARDANVEGLVLAKCVITVGGELTRCRILKGVPLMDAQVLAALGKWRYSPVLYQNKPVAVEYVVSVRLVLPR